MSVCVYGGSYRLVKKSGVGQAIDHQKKVLESAGVNVRDKIEYDTDIVHINTVFPDAFFTALRARAGHKKIIYYGHSTMQDFRQSFCGSNLLSHLFLRWIKICYSFGDVVITPTPYSKNLLIDSGVHRKIIPLSNGVDTSFFRPDPDGRRRFREKYGIAPDEKVVISAGHYFHRKGILEFIETAREMPDVKFIWFGHTPLNIVPADVRRGIKNAPDNLILPGFISQEELADAYRGCDLFLFLSHEETEGIVVLEALASKAPSLVRDIPVYSGWLEDGKNVYKASCHSEFTEKIRGILDGTLPDLTDEGLKVAENRSIGQIADKMLDIYQRLETEPAVHYGHFSRIRPFRRLKHALRING